MPYYTVEQLHDIITNRVKPDQFTCASDRVLLTKIEEAAKSSLFEHFTVHNLNQEEPENAVADYLMNKIQGPSISVYDTDLDCKAFSELLPTGRFRVRDAHRKQRVGVSLCIKSRLLNADAKYRINIVSEALFFHFLYEMVLSIT